MLLGPRDDLQARLHLREELEPLLLEVGHLPLPEAPACFGHPGIEQDVPQTDIPSPTASAASEVTSTAN